MSTTTAPRSVSTFAMVVGWIVAVAGLVMIVVGGVVWGYTSSQLASQNISVAPVTAEDPGQYAGDPVDSPWTALAQANAINEHTKAATKNEEYPDGRTYAEIKTTKVQMVEGKQMVVGEDGQVTDKEATAEQLADNALRTTAMNGALLQSALFTSVMAFGVAALIMGLGLLFIFVGVALAIIAMRKVPAPVTSQPAAEAAA